MSHKIIESHLHYQDDRHDEEKITISYTYPTYSLTSPYGHPYNTDTSLLRTVCLVPEMPKIIHFLPL